MSTPPDGGAAIYNPEPKVCDSGRPSINGIVQDHPRPLTEELREAYLGLLSLFYAGDELFGASARQSTQLLKLLMDRGPDRGYLSKLTKSILILDTLFISDTPGQAEAARRNVMAEELDFNFISGSRYLGAYLGSQEEFVACVKPQVEALAQRI